MRLIDADNARDKLLYGEAFISEELSAYIKRFFDELPTIDAVEVVRCKDCRHCGFCGESTNLEVMGFYGYCSRGERKDDEQQNI